MSRIMLVDDEIFILKMLEQMLRATVGCDVVCQKTVDDALQYLQENTVDLIVLDINMHGTSSLFFMDDLQANEQWKQIPVIMLSAMHFDEVKKSFMDRGAKAFFSKEDVVTPKARDQFIGTIKSYLPQPE